MNAFRAIVAGLFLIAGATSAGAGEPEADKKLIKRIFFEADLVPSLYALHDEKPLKFGSLPKFSEKKLTDYWFGKKEIFATQRDSWKADKERYAKDFPLRAAIFEAADENDTLKQLDLAMIIPMTTFTPKDKAAVLSKQQPMGMAIFKLKSIQTQMQETAAKRDQEKSKRWQATFDLALTRVQGNLIFLYEYNYALGLIRVDNLPELGKEHDGWKIAFSPKLHVTEFDAKTLARDRTKLLESIQKEHADTPWAYFAERDSKRDLGMTWTAKKK